MGAVALSPKVLPADVFSPALRRCHYTLLWPAVGLSWQTEVNLASAAAATRRLFASRSSLVEEVLGWYCNRNCGWPDSAWAQVKQAQSSDSSPRWASCVGGG